MSTVEQRQRMAAAIVSDEARRDDAGHLKVYKLPSGDGGGSYEVAGINDKYHPVQAAKLRALLDQGQYAEAEKYIVDYLIEYTNGVVGWHSNVGVEYFLRDAAFNRGPTGAARILQLAVGTNPDGEVGKDTRKALAEFGDKPAALIGALRASRERYERAYAHRDESSKFWEGLTNRWNKVYDRARKFADEAPSVNPQGSPKAPTVLNRLPSGLGAILGLIRWRKLPCFSSPKASTATPRTQTTLPLPTLAPPVPKRTQEAPRASVSPPTTPPAPQVADGRPPWYLEGLRHVGFHETGENQGIEEFIDGSQAGSREALLGQPWCAVWINYCLETSGVEGSRSAMARSFEDPRAFTRLTGPTLGAIGTMWRGSRTSGQGHCYFYAGEDKDGNVIGLSGNQDDGVIFAKEDMSRNTGWWWPKYEPLPAISSVKFTGDSKVRKET